MQPPLSPAGQLFLVAHYFLGWALSLYDRVVVDLRPMNLPPAAWEVWIDAAGDAAYGLQQSVLQQEPRAAFDADQLWYWFHDWSNTQPIMTQQTLIEGGALVFWAYPWWLAAVLHQYSGAAGRRPHRPNPLCRPLSASQIPN